MGNENTVQQETKYDEPKDDGERWRVKGIPYESIEGDHVLNKILGAIYGQALGDAVGFCCEFYSKEKIKDLYGEGEIPFPINEKAKGGDIRNGDWTDDTDQLILLMNTVVVSKEAVLDYKHFANLLKGWMKSGFPELGDVKGSGIGATVSSVCNQSCFLEDPHKASKTIWERFERKIAANGAVNSFFAFSCFSSLIWLLFKGDENLSTWNLRF